jgi:hypothetical protein
MLGQSVIPCSCSLRTVTSVPSVGVGAVVGGPRGSPSFQRAPRVPWARQKYVEGVGRFDDVTGARARRKLPPEAPISPETSPQGPVKSRDGGLEGGE